MVLLIVMRSLPGQSTFILRPNCISLSMSGTSHEESSNILSFVLLNQIFFVESWRSVVIGYGRHLGGYVVKHDFRHECFSSLNHLDAR